MNFLWFLLIGLAAGWLAGQITKGGGFGLVGDLVVGVIGAAGRFPLQPVAFDGRQPTRQPYRRHRRRGCLAGRVVPIKKA